MLRFARDVLYCNINDLDESITLKELKENGLIVKGDFVVSFTTDTPIEVYFD